MVYHLVDSKDKPEWCARMNSNGIGPLGNMYVFYAMINVLSFGALVWWARSQYLAKTSGYYNSDSIVIFPIYVNVLVFTAMTAIIQSLLFTYLYYVDINSGWLFYVAQGFVYGVYHIAIEGTTMLLLCAGIGRRAMIKSAIVGISYGSFTFICITIWFSSQSDQDENISENAGNVIYYIWTLSQLFIYLAVWLMPNSGIFTRRPSAIYWGRFLGLMRFGFVLCLIFNLFEFDFSYCLYHFLNGIIFCGFRIWVTYRVFFLDTLYWHGVSVEVNTCWGANVGRSDDGEGKDGNINILEGVELTGDSAMAMSSALDGFGRVRGESLTVECQQTNNNNNMQDDSSEVKKKRFSSILSTRAGRFSMKRNSTNGQRNKVPLLDFSHLEINSNKLLGVGSTARVYEGIWCGRKCAIKVLFTVEIVPEEIKRICLEASLLHSLQNVSNNVIRLFGIAMLPPSICVVLELCNEGSLNDVLYVKNADQRSTRKSSSISSGASSLSNDRKWTLLSELRNSSTTSSRQSQSQVNEYKYRLVWEERLDLILGACEGLATFAKMLPGYSHNDIKSANFLVHNIAKEGGGGNSSGENNKTNNRNIKKSFIVKLADLEMASVNITPEHLHRVGCIANWAAPEVLSNKEPVSPASDVFSLAMTLYEIVTRDIPFSTGNAAKYYLDGKRPSFPDYNKKSTNEEINNTVEEEDVSSIIPPSVLPPIASPSQDTSPGRLKLLKASSSWMKLLDGGGSSHFVTDNPIQGDGSSIETSPVIEVMSDEEIISRKLIEAVIIDAWEQEPSKRPDIMIMTENVRNIVKEYKTNMDINRRATFKGNLMKNTENRSSFAQSVPERHSSSTYQKANGDIAIEMEPIEKGSDL